MKFLVLTLFVIINKANDLYCEVLSNSDAQRTSKTYKFVLEQFIPDTTGDLPPVQDGELVLKEKCEKNGGNGSYEAVMEATHNVQKCFAPLKTFPELPSKIKAASSHGDVDSVFVEYCNHSNHLKRCINDFLFKLEPCLPENEKSNKYVLQNVTESVFSFVCDGEGNNIAVFYTEEGYECLASKKVGINRCLNETVIPYSNSTERNTLFPFVFDLEQCRSIVKLRKCLTNELITCTRTIAANVIDSIFTLIHTSTPCNNFTKNELDDDPNSALRYHTVATSIILPILTILLARNFN